MAHLWSGGILAHRDQFKSNGRATVGTFRPNSVFVEHFELVVFEPHQLRAPRAAAYLRCHAFPRTLQHR
jgi:hypothetical protein